jgi:hypothetical protein
MFMYWGEIDGKSIQVESANFEIINNKYKNDCNNHSNVNLTSILEVNPVLVDHKWKLQCFDMNGKYLYPYSDNMCK